MAGRELADDVDEEEHWNEARFRALTENSGDIISLLDAQGRLVFNSSAAERISGFTREELANVDTFEFIHPDDRAKTRRAFEHVLTTPDAVVTAQYRYRHKSGGWTWMEAVASNHLNDPNVRGVVAVSRDITERKSAEEELHRLVALNEKLVTDLRTADERKSTFLAELSHELRNPLAAIRSSVQLLGRIARLDNNAAHALAIIDRQSAHLSRLMDDLLDVTRIAKGKIRLEHATLDLCAVVRDIVEDLRASLRAHELRVDLPDGEIAVDGDRVRLTQVISNLLDNARKFTPEGGVISLSLRRTDSATMLEVRDEGVGIEMKNLETVFEPFAQSDRTLHRSGTGVGLGLALVRGIVELHGGTVRVESEGKGHGTRFTIRLPLSARHSRSVAAPAKRKVNGARRTILIIDDSIDAAEALGALLELGGHHVVTAHSGADGVARARELRPHIVLCDIGLPDLDGYAVARALRADPSTTSTHLIALSGYTQPEDQQRAREAGFDVHVAKPVDANVLDRLLARAQGTVSAPRVPRSRSRRPAAR